MGLFKVNGHEPIKNPASSLSRYDVWKNFDDMMNSMWPFDARLESGNNDLKAIAPRLNIQESKEGYHIEAELPGVARDQIDISVKDDMLIIKGEKKSFNEEKKDQYHRVERSHGSFYRAIGMPKDIDKERISAELVDGVLRIEVAKASLAENAERKISIK